MRVPRDISEEYRRESSYSTAPIYQDIETYGGGIFEGLRPTRVEQTALRGLPNMPTL